MVSDLIPNLNADFIMIIILLKDSFPMESRNSEILASSLDIDRTLPKSFELFKEFSGRNLANELTDCMNTFANADNEKRERLLEEAEREVDRFDDWLVQVKDVDEQSAHYLATGLKSVLAGLPFGFPIARLFDKLVDNL